MVNVRGIAAILIQANLALSCSRGAATESGPVQTPVPASHAVPKARVGAEGAPLAWAEAVRAERWEEAARAIRELPADAWRAPEIRFVFARIARELSDPASVVEHLQGLESELPLIAPRIERLRAEAQLEAGPYAEAASYFARWSDPQSLFLSGLALERAGELEAARKYADRVLAELGSNKAKAKKRAGELEVRARLLRARIAEQQGNKKLAAAELRWLATRAPIADGCNDVDARLERCARPLRLTKSERLERARLMADAGRVEDLSRELDALKSSPGPAPKPSTPLFLQAWALYNSRSDYRRAAELFERAAATGSDDVARDLFYAARARSRAYDNEAAFAGYREVTRRFPQTGYAETAAYLAAKMRYTSGSWAEAAKLYDQYLSRRGPRGRYHASATYERAVAWLAAGKGEQARAVFSKLAQSSKDRFEVARARQLEGVGLLEAGKREAAIAVFRQVIGDSPLSYHALVSAARLAQLGATIPPLIPAGQSGSRERLEVAMPETVEFFQRLGLSRDAEAELREQESTLRKIYGSRAGEALCELYGRLEVAERRYSVAQWAANRDGLDVAPSEATRWMWECVYPRPYASLVREVAQERLLSETLLHSIMRQESGFRSRVVSPAGAVGLMQLMPTTGERVARELNQEFDLKLLESPAYNVRFGSYYLRKLFDMFGGNVALAAAGYNAGPTAVFRWLDGAKNLPLDLFVARIPFDETRGYVERVISNLARYSFLSEGEASIPKLALELPPELNAPDDLY